MKVLLINGSTKKNGCVYVALQEVAKTLNDEGIEAEILQMGSLPIRDCIGCNFCQKNGKCVFDGDLVNEWLPKIKEADGFVFGSPVFYAHPTGQFLSLLDRLFYSGEKYFEHKVGASIVTARRAGTTASVDVMNRYFLDASMPIASSTYWNMVHGNTPQEILEDKEGLATMRNLGKNMAWLLKSLEAGKKAGVNIPEMENVWTNFVR